MLSFPSFRITPVITTFSIPAVPQAFPDLSVLKLLQSQVNEAPTSGQMTVRLPVGTTYRKIFLDMGGIGIPGTIDVIFNQADTPYSITPRYLRAINEEMYGDELPADVYALDFSYQGIANLGGLRDYIDTERLTVFLSSTIPNSRAAPDNLQPKKKSHFRKFFLLTGPKILCYDESSVSKISALSGRHSIITQNVLGCQ